MLYLRPLMGVYTHRFQCTIRTGKKQPAALVNASLNLLGFQCMRQCLLTRVEEVRGPGFQKMLGLTVYYFNFVGLMPPFVIRSRAPVDLWRHWAEWAILAFTSQPQSFTVLWPVLISHPVEGRRLSWPGWLITYRDGTPAKRNGHPSQY